MLVYDCEVFIKDWMFVFKDTETLEETSIVNDKDKLQELYNVNKDTIFIGYNSRHYDQYIFKGILLGLNPKKINDFIIEQGMNGGMFDKRMKDILLLNYDCQIDKLKSLKQLEGFMGNDIRETTVPFNIERKLTNDELLEVEKYCKHDVRQTLEVFNKQIEEFESHISLVKAFNMPIENLNKTKAQLSAMILGADKSIKRYDEFNITLPDTLELSEKYKYIADWYTNPKHFNYKLSLNTKVMGVPHKFAWGGCHGSVDNYFGEGFFVMSDIASMYPALMIEYKLLSRNVPHPERYKEIRDERIRLKKIKDPTQLPMKIVLNSTFGASKDKFNSLYDPLMANNVCIYGQLLILDLLDKLDGFCELIQTNTDGVLVKLRSKNDFEKYVEICNEWSRRTRLDLEHDIYVKVIQKDVNNYIIVDQKGKIKSKGGYVKKLNDLDYDLPIINKALVEKLVNNVPIEDTILNSNSLKEFQKIVKLSGKYNHVIHNNSKLDEKVQRVFASTNVNDSGLYKVKNETLEKVANTPESCFIYNDNVNDKECPITLDKQWYVDLANKRYLDFMEREKTLNEIDFYDLIQEHYDSFLELIRDIKSKTELKSKELDLLIKIGYFEQYGSIKKLLKIVELNKKLNNKKNIDKEKLEELGIDINLALKYGRETLKQIKDLNSELLLLDIIAQLSNDEFNIVDLVKLQLEASKRIMYVNPQLDKRYGVVQEVDNKYKNPTLVIYCLNNGKTSEVKLSGKIFEYKPFIEGDILYIMYEKLPKSIQNGVKANGKPNWVKDFTQMEWWIKDYNIIKELNN